MIKITTDIPYQDAKKIFKVFEDNIFMSFSLDKRTFIIMENDFYDEISELLVMEHEKETIDLIMEKQEITKASNPFFGNLSI